MTSPDFIAAIARPGDTVIIAYSGYLDLDVAAELAVQWDALLAGSGVKVHFTDDVASMVVIKGEDDA